MGRQGLEARLDRLERVLQLLAEDLDQAGRDLVAEACTTAQDRLHEVRQEERADRRRATDKLTDWINEPGVEA